VIAIVHGIVVVVAVVDCVVVAFGVVVVVVVVGAIRCVVVVVSIGAGGVGVEISVVGVFLTEVWWFGRAIRWCIIVSLMEVMLAN